MFYIHLQLFRKTKLDHWRVVFLSNLLKNVETCELSTPTVFQIILSWNFSYNTLDQQPFARDFSASGLKTKTLWSTSQIFRKILHNETTQRRRVKNTLTHCWSIFKLLQLSCKLLQVRKKWRRRRWETLIVKSYVSSTNIGIFPSVWKLFAEIVLAAVRQKYSSLNVKRHSTTNEKKDIVKYPTVLGSCIVIKMAVSMIPRHVIL